MAELCTAVYVKADVTYVKGKIANLRTVLKKELNKIYESKRSGAGADEICITRLWYFDSLHFLIDQDDARPSVYSLAIYHNSPDTDDRTPEELADSQVNCRKCFLFLPCGFI